MGRLNIREVREMAKIRCESCAEGGIETEATTYSSNPEWSGYELCEECAGEYNSRPPVDRATVSG